jgi:hypothetical protein
MVLVLRSLAISAMVCVVSGLAPLIRPRRFAPLLVTAETALALMLLIGAGLLLKSFVQLSRVNAGFHPEHLLTMQVDLPHASYPEARQRIEFYASVHDRLSAARRAGGKRGEPASGGRPKSEWPRGRSVQHRGTAVESVERGSAVCARHGRGSRLFSRDADPAAGGPRVQWRGRREFAARRGDQ